MYRPVLVTAPTIKPITLTEAKAWLDISFTAKDTVITALIAAATSHLDGWTGILGRCLCEQTWRQDFEVFARCLQLPLFPAISIVSIKYDDENGIEQTVASSNYALRTNDLGYYVMFGDGFTFPTLNDSLAALPPLRITYLAGYADIAGSPKTSSVPDDIKHAIALLVRHWFDNPSAVVVGVTAQKMPMAVDSLLGKYERKRF